MKTPVYLQLTTARQAPVTHSRSRNFFQCIAWKTLSSSGSIRLISLGLVSIVLSMTSSALAALQLGDRGPEVTVLQERLAATGNFESPISGFFDRFTQVAVIRFQQANGLLANGIVDSQTQALLDRQFAIATTQTYNYTPGNRILQPGDRGPDVEDVQRQLQAAGYYNGPLTGYFGTLTEQGVRRLQADRELPVNGIVDASTLAALSGVRQFPQPTPGNFINSGDRTIQLNSTGTDVSDLQRRLTSLGYYNGPINGYFDSATQAAVIRFQENYGLDPDGIVGPRTWVALSGGEVPRFPPLPPTYIPSNPPIAEAPSAPRYSILDLQKRLQERGLYNGPLDGIFGVGTQAAVEAAQRQYGVSRNDIIRGSF